MNRDLFSLPARDNSDLQVLDTDADVGCVYKSLDHRQNKLIALHFVEEGRQNGSVPDVPIFLRGHCSSHYPFEESLQVVGEIDFVGEIEVRVVHVVEVLQILDFGGLRR